MLLGGWISYPNIDLEVLVTFLFNLILNLIVSLYLSDLLSALYIRTGCEGTFLIDLPIYIAPLNKGVPWRYRLGREHGTLRLLPLPLVQPARQPRPPSLLRIISLDLSDVN